MIFVLSSLLSFTIIFTTTLPLSAPYILLLHSLPLLLMYDVCTQARISFLNATGPGAAFAGALKLLSSCRTCVSSVIPCSITPVIVSCRAKCRERLGQVWPAA
eukprot:755302-Hanusia_phi.AAC.1